MALPSDRRVLAVLLLAVVMTLAVGGFVLLPAAPAEASCSGFIECWPGDVGIRDTSYCCCEGRKLRERSVCSSNCRFEVWHDYDCGGGGCNPSGFCA